MNTCADCLRDGRTNTVLPCEIHDVEFWKQRVAGRARRIGMVVVSLLLALSFVPKAERLYTSYAACVEEERQSQVQTHWTPWEGCTATVLGTEVVLSP